LRQQEKEILSKISAALEKENMDKEKPGMDSNVLSRDIEEVREKVARMTKEREGKEGEGVRKAKESVISCYKCVRAGYGLVGWS
jgi:altered-inheritance-of-mitochondria protein 13